MMDGADGGPFFMFLRIGSWRMVGLSFEDDRFSLGILTCSDSARLSVENALNWSSGWT